MWPATDVLQNAAGTCRMACTAAILAEVVVGVVQLAGDALNLRSVLFHTTTVHLSPGTFTLATMQHTEQFSRIHHLRCKYIFIFH